MKIYCNRYSNYTLADFIGKPYWVLCYIAESPYNNYYLVKPISEQNGWYTCHLIHKNFIGVNDEIHSYMTDTINRHAIQLATPMEIYDDADQANWVSKEQYAELCPNEDDNDDYENAGIYPI